MALAAAGAAANPQTPQVISGQATFQNNGPALTVTNSPGAIIHWQSFGINRGELTRFVQQNAASAVLNRVTGADPSHILGALQSNGRVFLINPNGIVFGAGSQVDVAGLVVSSLRMSDQDFLSGRLRFGETPGAGEVRTEGRIRTAVGGHVVLVGPRVANSGLIEAPDGKILLAAGRSVEISDLDHPAIRVEISNDDEEAVNIGTLIGRHVSIHGGLVRNSGTIQANSAVMGENGTVTLRAKRSVTVTASSVIEANGPSGGTVLIQAEGDGLAASTLNFDYEIRPAESVFKSIPDFKLKGEMLDLARHIIDTKAGTFDPSTFDDHYDNALAELVKAKQEGRKIEAPKSKAEGKVVDLMEALRMSAKASAAKTKASEKAAPRRKAG